jgi:hypothetical protein
MLTRAGEVKLLDFGVAKAAQSSSLVQTQIGELKGKLGYMAPEILREAPYDQRADLFSVGVVLYELLVNGRLFQATTQAGLLAMNLGCRVTPPSQRGRDVPPALERIVLRALQADPEARPASAAEMLAELRALPEGRHFGPRDAARLLDERVGPGDEAEVTTGAPTRPMRARAVRGELPPARPRPWRFAVAALVMALGAAGGARALMLRTRVVPLAEAPALPVATVHATGDVMSSAELTLPLPGARAIAAPLPAPVPVPVPTRVVTKAPAKRALPHRKRKTSADSLINGRELMDPLGQ